MNIPFNKPFIIGKELEYIKDAIDREIIKGDGFYSKKCHEYFEKTFDTKKALLTHSCTAALEMAAILINTQKDDEIIMPSYTFVSTANAFVLRGGRPVFIDIREDTKNINEKLIEQHITSRTKAICVVHYAGVACDMNEIMRISKKYKIPVIEDAAQAIFSTYKGRHLGTIGDIGCFSFHETKNIISGEGGAIFINNKKYISRAEIIREKGTNRSVFFRGEVDKYTWCDIGSSFLPSDLTAAFLYAQLEKKDEIYEKRMSVWNFYHQLFEKFENLSLIKRPIIPKGNSHNAHMYYIIFRNIKERTDFISFLKNRGINSVFHYIPLHSSPAGKQFGISPSNMETTNRISDTLVRMPMYYNISDEELLHIKEAVHSFFLLREYIPSEYQTNKQ